MDFRIGQRATFSKKLTPRDIRTLQEISGHKHLDLPNPVTRSPFGMTLPHGAFTLGVISAALGTELPGPGTVDMSHTIRFLSPACDEDTVTARLEITAIQKDKGLITLKVDCANQHGEKIAEGEATVFHEGVREQQEPAREWRAGLHGRHDGAGGLSIQP